jgi:hypothetical protein
MGISSKLRAKMRQELLKLKQLWHYNHAVDELADYKEDENISFPKTMN